MLRLAHNSKPPLATLPTTSRGLVAHWTFQEGGGDIAHDRSGYNNTASLSGPTWVHVPGRGRVLEFDGSNDYIDVPARPEFNVGRADHYTVTGWFKTSDTSSTLRTFVEKRTTSGVSPFEMMVNNTHRFQIGTWNGSAAKIVVSTGTVNDGLWHFGAMVHIPNAAEGFLDGYSEGTYTGESGTTSNSENIRIGGDTSLSRYFPGQLDDIRIYNRALSAEEVMHLYRESRKQSLWQGSRRLVFAADADTTTYTTITDDLVAYWKLNEGGGTRFDAIASSDLTDNGGVDADEGKVDDAAYFFQSDDVYLSAVDSATLSVPSTDFTHVFWIYVDAPLNAVNNYYGIGHKGTTSTTDTYTDNEWAFRFRNANPTKRVWFSVGDGTKSISTSVGYWNHGAGYNMQHMQNSRWYMVVGEWDNTLGRISLWAYDATDGSYGTNSNTDSSMTSQDTTGPLEFGRVADHGDSDNTADFNGRIDEWGFWKRKLTEEERLILFSGGNGNTHPFLDLVDWAQQTQVPVLPRVQPQLHAGTTWVNLEPTLFIVPDVSDWWLQASEPVRTIPPRLVGHGYGHYEPTVFLIPLVSEWWTQANEPVWDLRRVKRRRYHAAIAPWITPPGPGGPWEPDDPTDPPSPVDPDPKPPEGYQPVGATDDDPERYLRVDLED